MPRQSKCWRIMAHDHEAAQALGCEPWVQQVEAIGWFPTKKAFADALAEAGLFINTQRALSEMARAGGETWNERSIAIASVSPGQVFVGRLSSTSKDSYIPWPPKEKS